MLIIGHRGAAGLKPENSIEAFTTGLTLGADMLEFDVRLTKDNIPIVMHDSHLIRTHKQVLRVRNLTFNQLAKHTKKTTLPALKLETVIKQFSKQIMLNIELKDRGSAEFVVPLLEKHMSHIGGWDNLFISSFYVRELKQVRKLAPDAQLAMLHYLNPLKFVAYERQLGLTAVGFHRLYTNRLALEIAQKLNIFTYVYTVNRPEAAIRLEALGVDGIITDYPDRMKSIKD